MDCDFQQIDYLASVDSSNDYLKQFVDDRRPRMVIAGGQTAGKGQFGRVWYSPPGGLYVSYLLFPEWDGSRAHYLNMTSSLSVLETIRGIDPDVPLKLKPPNDVFIGGRKVAGILIELSTVRDVVSWVIIGIGVNLGQREFPAELRKQATSIRLEGLEVPDRLDFCDRLTRELVSLLDLLESGEEEKLRIRYEKWAKTP